MVPEPVPSSVVLEPKIPKPAKGKGSTLKIRQLWEGTVVQVFPDRFVATLTDMTDLGGPDEQAELEFASFEIPPDDEPLVKPGSVFYLVMGIQTTHSGQVITISSLQFRRLPTWTRRSLENAGARIATLKKWLKTEASEQPKVRENE
jgi:hypothetical protein